METFLTRNGFEVLTAQTGETGVELVLKEHPDIVLRDYLECLEDSESRCQFSVPLGYRHFCKCPVRVYLTKKLNK
jgi:hypothetical protein